MTWDSDAYPINSSITIGLDYADPTEKGGSSAYTSDRTENSYGFLTITMDKTWLQDDVRNNLKLYIAQYDPSSDKRVVPTAGPMITLIQKPVRHYDPGPPTAPPTKLGFAIGLPLGVFAIMAIVIGLSVGMRKHREIGLGNVMGKNRGYAGGRSRAERLGVSPGAEAAIRLEGLEDDDPARYTDNPQPLRSDMDAYNQMERSKSNIFRGEISRLKSWK